MRAGTPTWLIARGNKTAFFIQNDMVARFFFVLWGNTKRQRPVKSAAPSSFSMRYFQTVNTIENNKYDPALALAFPLALKFLFLVLSCQFPPFRLRARLARSNKKPPASASGSIVTIFCFIFRCHTAADQETESEDNPVCHREHGQCTRPAHSHGKKPCNFHW